MRSHDFPALEDVIRSSTMGRWTGRIVQMLRAARSESQINAMAEMLRNEVSRLASAERHRSVGVVLIAAAVMCYGGSWLQPPHQKPLALPVIAIALFIIGGALVLAGDTVASSLRSSRVWSLCRRFMTRAPGGSTLNS